MLEKKLVAKILGVTLRTVYNHYNEKRPIIKLLEKSFSNADLERFLENEHLREFDIDAPIKQLHLNNELIGRIERLEQKVSKLEKKNEHRC